MKKQILVACAILAAACASVPPAPPAETHTHHTSAGKSDVDPTATLQPDEFDAAAPVSVAESTKPPGLASDPHAHHAHHGQPTTDHRPLTYVCPMHPEVTSATPGKCPKCGMSLVIRKDAP